LSKNHTIHQQRCTILPAFHLIQHHVCSSWSARELEA